MLKKRLIFSLLISNGKFQLSRNFQLQNVGDIQWLYDCYNLEAITSSVDELIILNVSRNPEKDKAAYFDIVNKLSSQSFVPLALGGGILTREDAFEHIKNGADKLVIGQMLFENPDLVHELVSTFGEQCIVGAVDFTRINNQRKVCYQNGTKIVDLDFVEALRAVERLNIGEIMLTSIEKDGTGQGLDLEAYELAAANVSMPIIASGGVGKFQHFIEGLNLDHVSAVSTANIFNFMSNGLIDARKQIINSGMPMAKWD